MIVSIAMHILGNAHTLPVGTAYAVWMTVLGGGHYRILLLGKVCQPGTFAEPWADRCWRLLV